ncbi:putative UDP-glucose:glycoprotein glucosyltransferase [Monocercomonoides exilis]|uniref:putative UDP-glucose:glycoprotein glucosyltransferase n=1 Tax=Monocercomonoides exilis TaxID=2049356 RepID=UPI00355A4CFB|nr:putative UDP-glucose:glycoprotein glucosyltransferase [Monocercomonoides exilis]|eukprot:MONOS_5761.1-p1 / transcript=MONOS_5761.1 / gene=MONOS_5761 / organism=Monocercomonoides_exilis_PA203 / gene_product=UDP-glucose / transcript_product=UDP-glucose / location=Mono_scaffold00172:66658-73947(+) / protein_length=2285 / sequence_SO=supercontig / SO=protein_coding / is_pseudo=false
MNDSLDNKYSADYALLGKEEEIFFDLNALETSLHSRIYENKEKLKRKNSEFQETFNNFPLVTDNDHVIPLNPYVKPEFLTIVHVYGNFDDPLVYKWVSSLIKVQKEISIDNNGAVPFLIVFRHSRCNFTNGETNDGSEEPMDVPGYGIELAVRDSEYTFSDTQARSTKASRTSNSTNVSSEYPNEDSNPYSKRKSFSKQYLIATDPLYNQPILGIDIQRIARNHPNLANLSHFISTGNSSANKTHERTIDFWMDNETYQKGKPFAVPAESPLGRLRSALVAVALSKHLPLALTKDFGMKAAYHIYSSDDPLGTLQRITSALPLAAPSIVHLSPNRTFVRMMEQQRQHYSALEGYLMINGRILDTRELSQSLSAWNLVDEASAELAHASSLVDEIGLGSVAAESVASSAVFPMLLNDQAIQGMMNTPLMHSHNAFSLLSIRTAIRPPSELYYLNNIEHDERFAMWIQDPNFLIRLPSGMFPQIKKNLIVVSAFVDLHKPESVKTVSIILNLIRRGVPIRFAIVPIVPTRTGSNTHIVDTENEVVDSPSESERLARWWTYHSKCFGSVDAALIVEQAWYRSYKSLQQTNTKNEIEKRGLLVKDVEAIAVKRWYRINGAKTVGLRGNETRTNMMTRDEFEMAVNGSFEDVEKELRKVKQTLQETHVPVPSMFLNGILCGTEDISASIGTLAMKEYDLLRFLIVSRSINLRTPHALAAEKRKLLEINRAFDKAASSSHSESSESNQEKQSVDNEEDGLALPPIFRPENRGNDVVEEIWEATSPEAVFRSSRQLGAVALDDVMTEKEKVMQKVNEEKRKKREKLLRRLEELKKLGDTLTRKELLQIKKLQEELHDIEADEDDEDDAGFLNPSASDASRRVRRAAFETEEWEFLFRRSKGKEGNHFVTLGQFDPMPLASHVPLRRNVLFETTAEEEKWGAEKSLPSSETGRLPNIYLSSPFAQPSSNPNSAAHFLSSAYLASLIHQSTFVYPPSRQLLMSSSSSASSLDQSQEASTQSEKRTSNIKNRLLNCSAPLTHFLVIDPTDAHHIATAIQTVSEMTAGVSRLAFLFYATEANQLSFPSLFLETIDRVPMNLTQSYVLALLDASVSPSGEVHSAFSKETVLDTLKKWSVEEAGVSVSEWNSLVNVKEYRKDEDSVDADNNESQVKHEWLRKILSKVELLASGDKKTMASLTNTLKLHRQKIREMDLTQPFLGNEVIIMKAKVQSCEKLSAAFLITNGLVRPLLWSEAKVKQYSCVEYYSKILHDTHPLHVRDANAYTDECAIPLEFGLYENPHYSSRSAPDFDAALWSLLDKSGMKHVESWEMLNRWLPLWRNLVEKGEELVDDEAVRLTGLLNEKWMEKKLIERMKLGADKVVEGSKKTKKEEEENKAEADKVDKNNKINSKEEVNSVESDDNETDDLLLKRVYDDGSSLVSVLCDVQGMHCHLRPRATAIQRETAIVFSNLRYSCPMMPKEDLPESKEEKKEEKKEDAKEAKQRNSTTEEAKLDENEKEASASSDEEENNTVEDDSSPQEILADQQNLNTEASDLAAGSSSAAVPALLNVFAAIDPMNMAQRPLISLLVLLRNQFGRWMQNSTLVLTPPTTISSMPMASFYHYVAPSPLTFDEKTGKLQRSVKVLFEDLPPHFVFTLNHQATMGWMVVQKEAKDDLDNIKFDSETSDEPRVVKAVYAIDRFVIHGHALDIYDRPAAGLPLSLVTETPEELNRNILSLSVSRNESKKDTKNNSQMSNNQNTSSIVPVPSAQTKAIFNSTTVIMSQLGYFQLSTPSAGVHTLSLAPALSDYMAFLSVTPLSLQMRTDSEPASVSATPIQSVKPDIRHTSRSVAVGKGGGEYLHSSRQSMKVMIRGWDGLSLDVRVNALERKHNLYKLMKDSISGGNSVNGGGALSSSERKVEGWLELTKSFLRNLLAKMRKGNATTPAKADALSSNRKSSSSSPPPPSHSSSSSLESSQSISMSQSSSEHVPATPKPAIHIFTICSGHLYERLAKIMMTSVVDHTKQRVKFWFIGSVTSPLFRRTLPKMAAEFGFDYEFVDYVWPGWLTRPTTKMRTVWAMKILFLDVLFPLDVERVIFVDADNVCRTDMMQLMELDMKGAPYAFTPFCSNRPEMASYRFWETGYWKSKLNGKPYHISALFAVDLGLFRSMGAGDYLRETYEEHALDKNSLSNLDQDLPNMLQDVIPIYSLDQNWLWCGSWCSDETQEKARTIDLCNNPRTKEHKLAYAKRAIPDWNIYHEKILTLEQKLGVNINTTTVPETPKQKQIPLPPNKDEL